MEEKKLVMYGIMGEQLMDRHSESALYLFWLIKLGLTAWWPITVHMPGFGTISSEKIVPCVCRVEGLHPCVHSPEMFLRKLH